MKKLYFVAVFCFLLVVLSLVFSSFLVAVPKGDFPDFFVGVDVAYDDVEEIKGLVDEINSYTNTLVVGSSGITFNISKLDDVCSYIYSRGMYFMIYMHPNPELYDVQRQWVEDARVRWGQRFLGLYAHDEPGGRQLDNATYKVLNETETPDDYVDAAEKYTSKLGEILGNIRGAPICAGDMTLFTSDYALYWFDYRGGYDVVFAEFGWNYSEQLNVAMCRGAATVQNKEWGVMITWTYNDTPYLESGSALYNDLVLAYENGAKYILVFDTNENYTDSVLEKEHLDALKDFWEYAKVNPREIGASSERVAYVLPEGFAYGFRGPWDKIWGFWEGVDDPLTYKLSVDVGNALDEYGDKLDIIYDDGIAVDDTYCKYIFWNGTLISGS